MKWKDIPGWEGLYQVSDSGFVKSLFRYKKDLKPGFDSDDYLKVTLSYKRKQFTSTVHRLVAQAFVPNPENKPEVNHIDGNKSNNNWWNLEWVTKKENHDHATKNNLKAKGESHGMVKLNESDVLRIRAEYKGRGKGPTLKQIAVKFGIKVAQTSAIINRKHWNHI